MRQALVSVPGKLILMGEHAAVYGHPALVAAIDMRLRVRMTESEQPGVRVDLPQLGFSGTTNWDSILEQTRTSRRAWKEYAESVPGQFQPIGGESPDRLVQLALGEAAEHLWPRPEPRGLHLSIDSQLPVGSGFGSSAAVAVGVAAAYSALLREQFDLEQLRRISLEVERRQHGNPSGVDNTAVLYGGLLWAQKTTSGGLKYEHVPGDSPLLKQFRVYQSGIPSESTGVLVTYVRRRIEEARARCLELLFKIDEKTRELRRLLALERYDAVKIIDLVKQCQAALEELGVVPEPIRRVIRQVEAAGGAAKISGAGALSGPGGGSVIVYHPDPEAIESWKFLKSWSPLPVRLGAEGVRLEFAC